MTQSALVLYLNVIACAVAYHSTLAIAVLISPVCVVAPVSVWHCARIELLVIVVGIADIKRRRRLLAGLQFSVPIHGTSTFEREFRHVVRILCDLLRLFGVLLLLIVTL